MKVLYNIIIALLTCVSTHAQNGLERIIVEKFYVSNEADKAVDGDGGELPVNSVTYRVYVDMLPGYIFQAAFGTPEHELKIATTTRFFNNQDRGARFPTYTRAQAANNTVMLDSWLSVGAAVKDHFGVMKINDDGVNTLVNADGVLQNAHPQAGIPLTDEDGLVAGLNEPVTVVGFFDTDLAVLDDANDAPIPSIISSFDGAWSSLNGSTGPDPSENVVLIGQFTTDGVFEFELNLQIRNQSTLEVEKYVARNPIDDEILFEQLIHIDSLEVSSATHDLITIVDQITVFPNPSAGQVNIHVDDQITLTGTRNFYTIQSLDRSSVLSGHITGHNTSVDAYHLLPGVYMLYIELENKYRFAEKIIMIR